MGSWFTGGAASNEATVFVGPGSEAIEGRRRLIVVLMTKCSVVCTQDKMAVAFEV